MALPTVCCLRAQVRRSFSLPQVCPRCKAQALQSSWSPGMDTAFDGSSAMFTANPARMRILAMRAGVILVTIHE